MSSESRTLRPYVVDKRLEEALAGARFHFGDQSCDAGEQLVLEDGTFGMRAARLEWSDEQCFEQFKKNLALGAVNSGIEKSYLCLAVTARSGYLKLCEMVYLSSLDDLEAIDRTIDLEKSEDGSRRQAFCADRHGVTIDAYVALYRAPRSSRLGRARKAAWLARAQFRVACKERTELFRPQPLTDEARITLNLSPQTMQYLEIESDCLTERLQDVDVPTLWVDEELLAEIDAHRGSPAARHLQSQMALEVIRGIVFAYARDVPEEPLLPYEELKDSLIGRVAKLMAGKGTAGRAPSDMLKMCREDPQRAIAWAEGAVGARGAALKSLQE